MIFLSFLSIYIYISYLQIRKYPKHGDITQPGPMRMDNKMLAFSPDDAPDDVTTVAIAICEWQEMVRDGKAW